MLSLSNEDLKHFSNFLRREYDNFHDTVCDERPDWFCYLRGKMSGFRYAELNPSKCALAVVVVAFQSCLPIPINIEIGDSWRSSFASKFNDMVKQMVEDMLPDDFERLAYSRLIRKRSDYYRALRTMLECLGLNFRVDGCLVPMPISLDSMFDKIDQLSARRRKFKNSYHSKHFRKLLLFLEGCPNISWSQSGGSIVNVETLKRYQHIQQYCCIDVKVDHCDRTIVLTSGYFDRKDIHWTPDPPKSSLLTEPSLQAVYQHFAKLTTMICPPCSVLDMNRDLLAMDQYRIIKCSYERCCDLLRHTVGVSAGDGHSGYGPVDNHTGECADGSEDNDGDAEPDDKDVCNITSVRGGHIKVNDHGIGRLYRFPDGQVDVIHTRDADRWLGEFVQDSVFQKRLVKLAKTEDDALLMKAFDLSYFSSSMMGAVFPILTSLGFDSCFMPIHIVTNRNPAMTNKILLLEKIFDCCIEQLGGADEKLISFDDAVNDVAVDAVSDDGMQSLFDLFLAILDLRKNCSRILMSKYMCSRYNTLFTLRRDTIVSVFALQYVPSLFLNDKDVGALELNVLLSNVHMVIGQLSMFNENVRCSDPAARKSLERDRLSSKTITVPQRLDSSLRKKTIISIASLVTTVPDMIHLVLSDDREKHFQRLLDKNCSNCCGVINLEDVVSYDGQVLRSVQPVCTQCIRLQLPLFCHGRAVQSEIDGLSQKLSTTLQCSLQLTDFFQSNALSILRSFPQKSVINLAGQNYPNDKRVVRLGNIYHSRKRIWRGTHHAPTLRKSSALPAGSMVHSLSLLLKPWLKTADVPTWVESVASLCLRINALMNHLYDNGSSDACDITEMLTNSYRSQFSGVNVQYTGIGDVVASNRMFRYCFAANHPIVDQMRKLGYTYTEPCFGNFVLQSFQMKRAEELETSSSSFLSGKFICYILPYRIRHDIIFVLILGTLVLIEIFRSI